MKPDMVCVDPDNSLFDAVRCLRAESIHRVLVVDGTAGNGLYVLTYKNILKFLYNSVCSRRDDRPLLVEIHTCNGTVTCARIAGRSNTAQAHTAMRRLVMDNKAISFPSKIELYKTVA